jgi:8-oxo-dGTP diphosphatase
LVGVAAVVVDGGRVLLARRGRQPLKGEWSLPGGALELGETLEQGVAREVLEECGLAVAPVAVVEVLDRIVRDEGGRVRYHYVLVDFLCRVAGQVERDALEGATGAPKANESLRAASDCLEARWVAHEELNSHSFYKLEPRTVMVIEKALRMAANERPHSSRTNA